MTTPGCEFSIGPHLCDRPSVATYRGVLGGDLPVCESHADHFRRNPQGGTLTPYQCPTCHDSGVVLDGPWDGRDPQQQPDTIDCPTCQ